VATKTDDRTPLEEITNLGPCHYCGEEEDSEATGMATRSDGTGWIGVCDKHKDEAKKDGFEPEE
jgi:hypothetical protein